MSKMSIQELLGIDHPGDLDEVYEAVKKDSEACEKRNYDKLQYSNPYSKQMVRIRAIQQFKKLPVHLSEYGPGLLIVNHKYIYALQTGQWRVQGKNKWYRSRDPEQFVYKYVLKRGN